MLGALFLGETLQVVDLVGMLLIGIALLVIDGRLPIFRRSAA